MKPLHALIFSLLFATGAAAWSQVPEPRRPDPQEEQDMAALEQAVRLSRSGQGVQALAQVESVIAAYEERYRKSRTFVYSSRGTVETMLYLVELANNQKTTPGDGAVFSRVWGDAWFVKGYLLIEMNRLAEARTALEAAVALAPRNSQYRGELAQLHSMQRSLDDAMREFKRAETDAREFSPPEVRTREVTRALRGQAYILIEQQQLDEAEKLYRQCLQLDPGDRRALSQLGYIQQVRQRGAPLPQR